MSLAIDAIYASSGAAVKCFTPIEATRPRQPVCPLSHPDRVIAGHEASTTSTTMQAKAVRAHILGRDTHHERTLSISKITSPAKPRTNFLYHTKGMTTISVLELYDERFGILSANYPSYDGPAQSGKFSRFLLRELKLLDCITAHCQVYEGAGSGHSCVKQCATRETLLLDHLHPLLFWSRHNRFGRRQMLHAMLRR